MKRYLKILSLLFVATVSGCGLDNKVAPESKVVGRVVHNGQPVGVRGTGEAVQLQIFQDGYQLRNPIPVFVGQDGTFEAKLFDGEYKIVTRNNNGPWVNTRDTTVFVLKGTTNVDIEVTPLFTLSQVGLSLAGNNVSASFQINQITPNWTIDYVSIVVGRTSFVDDVSQFARREIRDLATGVPITQSLELPSTAGSAGPLFARVGVRAQGKDQAIYSETIKIR